MIDTDCTNSCKSNYRTNTTTTAPALLEVDHIMDYFVRFNMHKIFVHLEFKFYISGVCVCNAGYTGEDCRIDMSKPPVLSGVSDESICDVLKRPCTSISMFGDGFYSTEKMKCRFQNAKVCNLAHKRINIVYFIH